MLPEGHWLWRATPKLYADAYPLPLVGDGEERTVVFDAPVDEATNLPFLSLYVFEHEDVVRCRGNVTVGSADVRLRLSGSATIMGREVPFRIDATAVHERA